MTNTQHAWTARDLAESVTVDFGGDGTRLILRIARLVAQGRPVTQNRVDQVIADLGIPADQADGYLRAYTERDDNGDIIGSAPGITLRETPHKFTTDTAQMWAWCAGDTLVLPRVLNQTVRVESTAPVTHDVVRLTVTPSGVTDVEPADAVMSWAGLVIDPDAGKIVGLNTDPAGVKSVREIWTSFCHRIFFFPTRAQAVRWAEGKDDIAVVAFHESADFAGQIAEGLLAHE